MYDSKTEDQNPAKRIIRNSIQPTFEEELLAYIGIGRRCVRAPRGNALRPV